MARAAVSVIPPRARQAEAAWTFPDGFAGQSESGCGDTSPDVAVQAAMQKSVQRIFCAAAMLLWVGGAFASGDAARWKLARPAARAYLLRGYTPIEALAADGLRPVERSFLDRAAEISREEVRIARLGTSQAASTEVRTFASQLATDHRAIADAVEALRRRKGAAAIESAPAEAPSDNYQKLAAKTGAEFDREFVRVIGEMHAETMSLFERAVAEGKDADVKDLAASFLPTLREHTNRLVELRKALE
jgi:putative membrane protein